MDTLTLLRIVLPVIGTGIFVLVATLTRAPRYVTFSAVAVCWVAGLINGAADALANVFHIWHYTLSPFYYGLPIDFYITVSLVYGGAVALIYWRITDKPLEIQGTCPLLHYCSAILRSSARLFR